MRLWPLAVVLLLGTGCLEIHIPSPEPASTDAPAPATASASTRTARAPVGPPPAAPPPGTATTGPGPLANGTHVPVVPAPDHRLPHVTVATFDTGVNPFHPAWRSARDPRADLWGLPMDAVNVSLVLGDSFQADWSASQSEWAKVHGAAGLVVFEGTRMMGVADPGDPTPFLDYGGDAHSHGARASTQIAGTGYAVADHAYIVAFDHTGGTEAYESFQRSHTDWLVAQEWIDIVHINFGFPAPYPVDAVASAVARLVDAGKLVVLPALNGAGNGGAPYPMEFGELSQVPGTLVAGANDQCAAGAHWSNLNPHVVMDGQGTVAGESLGYGDAGFSGTSSSSPRTAGYAAEVLFQVRLALNVTDGMQDRALVRLAPGLEPAQGPLADGRLDASELHEAIRKTARPAHDSWLDGQPFASPCPAFPEAGDPDYAKVGYGEVSDATLADAVAVVLGQAPMPIRAEDPWYERSETLRHAIFG